MWLRSSTLALLAGVAFGCSDPDASVPESSRVLTTVAIHGGDPLEVTATIAQRGRGGGPWGWIDQLLFFVPTGKHMGVSLAAASEGVLYDGSVYLWTTSHLSGDDRWAIDESDVLSCADADHQRVVVGVADASVDAPERWVKLYAHGGRVYPAGEAFYTSCEQHLANMPPLREWLIDRSSSTPSTCELADWFELEISELHCEIDTERSASGSP